MRVMFDHHGAMSLEDVDDFTAFEAHAACSLEALDCGLAGAGRREGGAHLWIDRHWILANGRPDDQDWRARLEAMLAYAARRGWLDEDGAVRAHLVWSGPAAPDDSASPAIR